MSRPRPLTATTPPLLPKHTRPASGTGGCRAGSRRTCAAPRAPRGGCRQEMLARQLESTQVDLQKGGTACPRSSRAGSTPFYYLPMKYLSMLRFEQFPFHTPPVSLHYSLIPFSHTERQQQIELMILLLRRVLNAVNPFHQDGGCLFCLDCDAAAYGGVRACVRPSERACHARTDACLLRTNTCLHSSPKSLVAAFLSPKGTISFPFLFSTFPSLFYIFSSIYSIYYLLPACPNLSAIPPLSSRSLSYYWQSYITVLHRQ